MKDRRYTITREWCGYAQPRHVVRFCDTWVGQGKTKAEALELATEHAEARDRVLRGAA